MKKYMPLNGLRWSRDSGSALCGVPPNSRSRTGWGGVTVCNNVTIGASALVLKSITTEYCTVAGIPAKIISIKDPSKPLIRG